MCPKGLFPLLTCTIERTLGLGKVSIVIPVRNGVCVLVLWHSSLSRAIEQGLKMWKRYQHFPPSPKRHVHFTPTPMTGTINLSQTLPAQPQVFHISPSHALSVSIPSETSSLSWSRSISCKTAGLSSVVVPVSSSQFTHRVFSFYGAAP